jgi:hypothetical protein
MLNEVEALSEERAQKLLNEESPEAKSQLSVSDRLKFRNRTVEIMVPEEELEPHGVNPTGF